MELKVVLQVIRNFYLNRLLLYRFARTGAFCYNWFMKKFFLLAVLVLFSACDNRAVVDDENIQKPLPEGWEFFDKKTVREELRPSKLEEIVPEDF